MNNLFEAVDNLFETGQIILDEEASRNNRIEALKALVQEHRALNEAKESEEQKDEENKEQSKNN